jgi:hypothetical protein
VSDMSGLGAGHVWEMPLESGLGPDISGSGLSS